MDLEAPVERYSTEQSGEYSHRGIDFIGKVRVPVSERALFDAHLWEPAAQSQFLRPMLFPFWSWKNEGMRRWKRRSSNS